MLTEDELHSGETIWWFKKDYLSEFVYGGIDGAITTFAVVSGAAGANAEIFYILIFGFANLIADGFSMSVGNYFAVKAERHQYEQHKAIEYWEVENLREKEVQEIREIYAAKGFEGDLLEQVVNVITSNKDVWVDTMMKEELEMTRDNKTPVKTAFATFVSFNVIGIIPLIAYLVAMVADLRQDNLFLISCVATGFALTIIGFMKSKITEKPWLRGILETVLLGGLAAVLAYFAGEVLAAIFID